MAFLEKAELKTKSTIEIIDIITNSDNDTITNIINENIAVIKSYLFKQYDVEAIFNAVDQSRSQIIIKHLKSLVIFDIYEIRGKTYSEATEKKYDEAMRWLELMSKGTIEADLPPKLIDADGDGAVNDNQPFMRLGSNKTYKNHY